MAPAEHYLPVSRKLPTIIIMEAVAVTMMDAEQQAHYVQLVAPRCVSLLMDTVTNARHIVPQGDGEVCGVQRLGLRLWPNWQESRR